MPLARPEHLVVLPKAVEEQADRRPCLAIVTARQEVGEKKIENACLALSLTEPVTLTFSAGVVVVATQLTVKENGALT